MALEGYGLRDARVEPLKRSKGKRKSIFYAESSAAGGFLLRLYETRQPSDDALRSEALWLRSLRGAGLPVPEPVPANDGSLVVRLPGEGSEDVRRCMLLRWLPGETGVEDPGTEDLRRAGSIVARLHLHSERLGAPEGFARPRLWDGERLFGAGSPLWTRGQEVYSPDEMGVLQAAAERIGRDLEDLGNGADVFGVVHGDLNLENYLFRRGCVHVIDFEHCGWGHYLHDVTTTLSALQSRGAHRAALQAAFLEGYRRERALPEDHHRYFGTFAAMRTARRIASVVGRDPERRSWSQERLEASVRRLRAFVESDEETGQRLFS